jgi:predicted enzyme related to lactoylglutathione lyase
MVMDRVVHFEIPFDDKPRAMKLYAGTFGWQPTDMPQMNYVGVQTAEVDQQQMPKERGAIRVSSRQSARRLDVDR